MRARIPVCTAWRQKTETQVREVSVRFTSRSKNQEMPQPSSPLFQTESPRTTQLISTGGKKEAGFPFLDTGPATAVSAPHSKSPAAVPVSYLSYSHLWKGTQSIQGLCEKEIFLILKKTKNKKHLIPNKQTLRNPCLGSSEAPDDWN